VNSCEKLALESQGGSNASACRGCGAKKNNRHQIWESGREEKKERSFEFIKDGDLRKGMVSGWKREILFRESSGGVGRDFQSSLSSRETAYKMLDGKRGMLGWKERRDNKPKRTSQRSGADWNWIRKLRGSQHLFEADCSMPTFGIAEIQATADLEVAELTQFHPGGSDTERGVNPVLSSKVLRTKGRSHERATG
jgi:hypothetical protein